MRTAGELLRQFTELFRRDFLGVFQPDREHLAFRKRLIKEEFQEVADELDKAMRVGKLTDELRLALAKELSDLSYVVYGTAVEFGIDLDECVVLVHESNMTKLGEDGKPIFRHDGKVLKGPNYSPPDLTVPAGIPVDGTVRDELA